MNEAIPVRTTAKRDRQRFPGVVLYDELLRFAVAEICGLASVSGDSRHYAACRDYRNSKDHS